MTKRDKRKYLEYLADQAEEAASRGKQGVLFKITKQICGKFTSNTSGPVKDKQGNLLTTEHEIEQKMD